MRKIFMPVHIKFLEKNIKGRSYVDITGLFNRRFGLSVSVKQMKHILNNRRITNGVGHGIPKRKYFDKHLNYLRKITPGTPLQIVMEKFNKKFGFSLNLLAFQSLCGKYGIKNGVKYRWQKGHIPHNKGKKGYCAPGSEKGWFKKGNRPQQWRPVGSERVTVDGYVEVKISDISTPCARLRQKNWKMKHNVIWEKAHGPIPKGHIIIFLDGNKKNIVLKNLFMLSRQEHMVMCHLNLYTNDRETTRANCLMAQIKVASANLKRKTFKAVKNKKMIFLNNGGYKVFVIQEKGRYIPVRETSAGNLVRLWVSKLKPRASRSEAQRDLYEYAAYRGWMRI